MIIYKLNFTLNALLSKLLIVVGWIQSLRIIYLLVLMSVRKDLKFL